MDISNELVEYKDTQLSQGRVLFNKCLPEDYPVIDKQIDSSILKNLMNDIAFKYSPTVVIDTLNKIQKLGFMVSTLTGFTLGIDDLYSESLENIANKLTGRKDLDLVTLSNEEVMSALKDLPFAVYINSGARGSWDQVKQLVLCRGYVADANGDIGKVGHWNLGLRN